MHCSTLVAALVGLVSVTTAAPSNDAAKKGFTVTLYPDDNFQGQIASVAGKFGTCHNTKNINDAVSSLKTNGASCTLYQDYGCKGATYGPIQGNVPSLEGLFNDEMSAIKCTHGKKT